MPENVPKNLDAIDADWLIGVLRRHGHEAPEITGVRVEPLKAENSSVARLHLSGQERATSTPATLFLKLSLSDHGFLGKSEIAYYTRDYEGLSDAPIVPCYAAVGRRDIAMADSIGVPYALLLADLSTDFVDNKLIEPTDAHAASLGRAIGRLHAHRWGEDADPEGPHDLDADFDRCLAHVSSGLAPVLDALGDAIDAASRKRLLRVFEEDVARVRVRAQQGAGLTLVHGDPNPTNVLTPRTPNDQGNGQPLFLIDRQPFDWSLRLWLGASDLVLASVPYWSVDARRARERALLRGYHAALLADGVADYSWDALIDDWRACLVHAVLVAVEWGSDPATLDRMRWLWEAQLTRALWALDDWERGNPPTRL
ncbi:MAG: hypothetical protein AAFX92_02720 [Pseudomonadota bacterium]